MVPNTSTKHQTDANGNFVSIAKPENFRVAIKGKNNSIKIDNTNSNASVSIQISGDDNVIEIGSCILKDLSIAIGSSATTRGASIRIGNNFSIEPGGVIELYTSFGEILVGDQCLVSRNVTFHFGDSPHLIFDNETGRYVDGDGKISIGDKVWIGEGSYLSKRAILADETIVAARSVVTRKFDEPNCVIGGNPATVVKRGVQWFRNRTRVPSPTKFSEAINAYDQSVAKGDSLAAAPRKADDISTWGSSWPENATCLFGVGAMKAGTSYIYDYLKSHPDVHFGRLKEVHYFNVLDFPNERHHFRSKVNTLAQRVEGLHKTKPADFKRNIQLVENAMENLTIYKNSSDDHCEYRDFLLDGYTSQRIVGDITPSYCVLSPERLAEMYRLAPRVKFLFVLRDPVDRLWSAIRMHAKQQDGDFAENCASFAAEIIERPNHYMLSRSDYKSTVEKLDEVAQPEDLHFMFYETMFLQPARDELCDFLGIAHHEGSDSRLVNAGRPQDMADAIRDGFFEILKPQYDFVASRFGSDVPESWSN